MNHSFIDQVDRVPSFELFHPLRRFPDPRPRTDWWGLSIMDFYLNGVFTRFDYFLFRSTVSCDMFLLLVVLLFNDRLIFNYSTFRVTIVQFYNFRGFFTSTRDFLFQYISWKVIEVSLATMFMEHLNKFANDVVGRCIWLWDPILYFTSRIVCEISWSSRRFCYIVRNGWSILLLYAYSLVQFIGRRISRMLLLWTFYLKKYIIYPWSIRARKREALL